MHPRPRRFSHVHTRGDVPSLPRPSHPFVEVVPLPQLGLSTHPRPLPSASDPTAGPHVRIACPPPASRGKATLVPGPPPAHLAPQGGTAPASATPYSQHASLNLSVPPAAHIRTTILFSHDHPLYMTCHSFFFILLCCFISSFELHVVRESPFGFPTPPPALPCPIPLPTPGPRHLGALPRLWKRALPSTPPAPPRGDCAPPPCLVCRPTRIPPTCSPRSPPLVPSRHCVPPRPSRGQGHPWIRPSPTHLAPQRGTAQAPATPNSRHASLRHIDSGKPFVRVEAEFGVRRAQLRPIKADGVCGRPLSAW